jgi:hypothetical protein
MSRPAVVIEAIPGQHKTKGANGFPFRAFFVTRYTNA